LFIYPATGLYPGPLSIYAHTLWHIGSNLPRILG
jgi:hypothetical protein